MGVWETRTDEERWLAVYQGLKAGEAIGILSIVECRRVDRKTSPTSGGSGRRRLASTDKRYLSG